MTSGPPQKVFGLLLAAGESSRMGTEKQLLTISGRSFVQIAVDGLLAAGADPIVVVLGHCYDGILGHLKSTDFGFPPREFDRRILIARNADYKKGQLSSIKCGLSLFLQKNQIDFFRGFMLQLIDRPMVGRGTFTKLLQSFTGCDEDIMVPSFAGRRGHPACFSSRLIGEILGLGEQGTLRDIISRHENGLRHVEVEDPGITVNVDTPEDYEKIKGA